MLRFVCRYSFFLDSPALFPLFFYSPSTILSALLLQLFAHFSSMLHPRLSHSSSNFLPLFFQFLFHFSPSFFSIFLPISFPFFFQFLFLSSSFFLPISSILLQLSFHSSVKMFSDIRSMWFSCYIKYLIILLVRYLS